jgi:hypothetical protein
MLSRFATEETEASEIDDIEAADCRETAETLCFIALADD